MLHHVTLWVPDLERAARSWGWLLGELGYEARPPVDGLALWRHPGGLAVALERSPDMVPGMLHSRFRPGLNHLAFLAPAGSLPRLSEAAPAHGWSELPADRHPIAGWAPVVYLEDGDGFEVELVAGP